MSSPPDPEVTARRTDLAGWYDSNRDRLARFTGRVHDLIAHGLAFDELRVASVESRTKSRDSFLDKAVKLTEDGFRYAEPVHQITDLCGARVVTFLRPTVDHVLGFLRREFEVLSEEARGFEEGELIPGYRSVHLLVRLPQRRLENFEDREFSGLVAEVQVRTLLQHTWAAIQHDILYKGLAPVPAEMHRRLVSLAGMLELADAQFASISNEYDNVIERIDAKVDADSAGGPQAVTPSSLRLLVDETVASADDLGQEWFLALEAVVGELGLEEVGRLRQVLTTTPDEVRAVFGVVKGRNTHATPVEVLDAMLRLRLGRRYLESRRNWREAPDGARDEMSRAFDAEVAKLRAAVERT
jgi:ppGpp synthetase/RelA/SpoT-type nucleotidyltranferase